MNRLTFGSLLDVIGELFSDEISIAVSDTSEYVYYRPSKRIDLKIKPGDPVVDGTIAHKALNTGQKVSEFIDRNVFGVPYHGMAVPFHQDGELEGCVTAIYPVMTEGKSVVTVKTLDGWRPIPFHDVVFMEAKDRKTHVVVDALVGTTTRALQDYEYSLPREMFIRCHRSFIVNVHHIRDIFPDTHSTFMLAMDKDRKSV